MYEYLSYIAAEIRSSSWDASIVQSKVKIERLDADTKRLFLSVTSVFKTLPMLADCKTSLMTRLGAVCRAVNVHSDTPKIDDNMGNACWTGPRCQQIAECTQSSMICHCDWYSTSDAPGHSSCCSCKDLCSRDHRPQTLSKAGKPTTRPLLAGLLGYFRAGWDERSIASECVRSNTLNSKLASRRTQLL